MATPSSQMKHLNTQTSSTPWPGLYFHGWPALCFTACVFPFQLRYLSESPPRSSSTTDIASATTEQRILWITYSCIRRQRETKGGRADMDLQWMWWRRLTTLGPRLLVHFRSIPCCWTRLPMANNCRIKKTLARPSPAVPVQYNSILALSFFIKFNFLLL